MRTARIKIDEADTWYHCYNRVAGTSQDRPFRNIEKEQFLRILRRVSLLYDVQILAYQVMSNHYHLLVHAPRALVSQEEVCRRYSNFHHGRKTLDPDSSLCLAWQRRIRDISWFMRHLQQLFAVWYNRSRCLRRRGPLWADRFKHTILESGAAVWSCWKYIENNAVRAGMAKNASDYRFCSFGAWCRLGRHPFGEAAPGLVLAMLGLKNAADLLYLLRSELDVHHAVASNGSVIDSSLRLRYWIDGLIIGSELFVRHVMALRHPHAATRRIMVSADTQPPLACWRRLRQVAV